MVYLLGIDIGTSACKVALFSVAGSLICQKSSSYQTIFPQAGWAEQDPNDWWRSVCQAIQAILSETEIEPQDILGIGVAGQSWAAVPLAKDGTVLGKTPIWMDTRSQQLCDEFNEQIGAAEIFRVSGNALYPSYSLPKVLWLQKYQPEIYRHTDKFLQANSFIGYQLTGQLYQDVSQGYGYQFFDMQKARWDQPLANAFGINLELLPEIVNCQEIIGRVSKKAQTQTGLAEGTPVIAGGLDAACGALGAGVLQMGDTQEQGGQAGGMSICTDEYLADKNLILSYHVTSKNWLLQGGTVGGGGVLNWLEAQFGFEERIKAEQNRTTSFVEMGKLAEAVAPGSEGLIFLPYMSGERSPIWDPQAKGVYFGLDYSKTKGHLIRSSMEGVAYSLKHNLDVAQKAGLQVTRLKSVGGSANSALWSQIKSDVTNQKIDIQNVDTATTLGAALLAGVAVGVYRDFSDAVEKTVKVQHSYAPRSEFHDVYQENYQKYLAIYQQLKPITAQNND